MSPPIFILGAPDAEMAAIERLLAEVGVRYLFALAPLRGSTALGRVPPGGSGTHVGLLTDGVPGAGGPVWTACEIPAGDICTVEVSVAGITPAIAIDHHDPDPRARLPPAEFLAASALGQVISLLTALGWDISGPGIVQGPFGEPGTIRLLPAGWAVTPGGAWVGAWTLIPQALVMEAAADHCPAAAAAGQCPGFDPAAYREFFSRSKHHMYQPGWSPERWDAEVARSIETLLAAPRCPEFPAEVEGPDSVWTGPYQSGLPDVADLRHLEPDGAPAQGTGEVYPAAFVCGIVASVLTGRPFLCRIRGGDGSLRLRGNGFGLHTPGGSAPAEVFLADPRRFGCLTAEEARASAIPQANPYGSGVRGFLGGTLRDQG